MRRVQDGELGAFADLYNGQRALVYNVGLRVLGDWALAEDLTQMVFLKVWARPSAFRGGSVEAWISRVARNAAIDHIRRHGRDVSVEFETDVQDETQLGDLIVARLEEERLRRLLFALSEAKRSAIESNFFEGRTHEEIAVASGVPLGTVKTRIRDGLQNLRNAFANPDPSPIDVPRRSFGRTAATPRG